MLFLGAQRALLLEIAHPVIARGVDAHSTFRQRPVTRLWSTTDAMLCMVWGTDAQAAAAHRRVMAVHDRVNGAMPRSWHESTYSAHDPDAQTWVWATLVETTFQVHERWLVPLADNWGPLYSDWIRFGEWFGLPVSDVPRTPDSFRPWYSDRLASLTVTDEARDLARSILDPPLWFVPRSVKRAHALVATGLLDPQLRAEFGLEWNESMAAGFDRVEKRLRAAWAAVPTLCRAAPSGYVGALRISRRSCG